VGSLKATRILDFLVRKGFSPDAASRLMTEGKVNLLGRREKIMHQAADIGMSALAGDKVGVQLSSKEIESAISSGIIYSDQLRYSGSQDYMMGVFEIRLDDCSIEAGMHCEEVVAYWEAAMNAQQQGDHNEAIKIYTKALGSEENPRDRSIILYNTALAYSEIGEYEQALECYRQALHLDGEMPQALNNMAVIYHCLGCLAEDKGNRNEANQYFKEAERRWRDAIRLAPNNYIEAQDWLKTRSQTGSGKALRRAQDIRASRLESSQDEHPPSRMPNFNVVNSYIFFWKDCLKLKGRISRRDFWVTALSNVIVLAIAVSAIALAPASKMISMLLGFYIIGMGLASLTLQIRRIRDTGFSPWLALLVLVPYVGSIFMIIFCCLPSNCQTRARRSSSMKKPATSDMSHAGIKPSEQSIVTEFDELSQYQSAIEESLKKLRKDEASQ
jgi:uncharacterized membrane protein YhaH (DUF805 family)